MNFKAGQLIWVEVDFAAGPARIIDDSDPSRFKVEFLESSERRFYTKKNPPFKRVELTEGQRLRVKGLEGEKIARNCQLKNNLFTFEVDAKTYTETDVLELSRQSGVLDLLQQKKFSPIKYFSARKRALELLSQRQEHPFKGAVGCRVELMPHQYFVLSETLKMQRCRSLLADEVGLGKTIEAGLIFSALHAQKKLKRVLVLVPSALKVQWLTECFRRFNVRFRLEHEDLIEDDEHRDFIISSLEEIEKDFEELDLLIVDEAHRLVHDATYREQLSDLVKRSTHVLFLSATPRLHGDQEFKGLLEILSSSQTQKLPVKIFQARREELGLKSYRKLEAAYVENKLLWLQKFLGEKIQSPAKEKVFIIATTSSDVITLHRQLKEKLGQHFALFHEKMDLVERDRQAAYFSDPEGAQFLISSEIGGEGRNFQFCHNMVLYDLPNDPLVIEQRIGRLDRIGQTSPVKVWVPVSSNPVEEEVFESLRDEYHVFEKPWSGSGREDLDPKEHFQSSTDLNALFDQTNSNFEFVKYNSSLAKTVVENSQELEKVRIDDVLDSIYDVFGVEVEDFDTHGNWKVSVSSLMFVESFPGLGENGEMLLSFERKQALAREDLRLFTLDHPDFIETLEFFIQSEHGKLSLAELENPQKTDLIFVTLTQNASHLSQRIWSYSEKKVLHNFDLPSPYKVAKEADLPKQFLELLPSAYMEMLKSFEKLVPSGEQNVEALAVFVPKLRQSGIA